uniref:Uncharacterized protein n=1 Tax=Physcomitrium patens TaxID=3218 RepID=A0A2K1INM4_PHYPA|nr:hypothetical protein PHYPA_027174 [Physcomitrium patens]
MLIDLSRSKPCDRVLRDVGLSPVQSSSYLYSDQTAASGRYFCSGSVRSYFHALRTISQTSTSLAFLPSFFDFLDAFLVLFSELVSVRPRIESRSFCGPPVLLESVLIFNPSLAFEFHVNINVRQFSSTPCSKFYFNDLTSMKCKTRIGVNQPLLYVSCGFHGLGEGWRSSRDQFR